MTSPRNLFRQKGSAATEFALSLPLMLLLLFGGLEAGHFIWTQHKLTEAVRNGVRFASRLQADKVCPPSQDAETLNQIRLVTRTGQLANTSAKPVVPGWTADEVLVTCDTFVSTGIYTELGNDENGNPKVGATVTIKARNVVYPWLFVPLEGADWDTMSAEASAAVTEI